MSRTLSKLFIKINFGIYALNFAVLFTVGIMLINVTGNASLLLIPGMLLTALICLVYPDFYNVIGDAFGWENVTTPTAQGVMDNIKTLWNNAFDKDYSAINQALPLATVMVAICFVVGIVGLCMQRKLLLTCQAPMDWYKKYPIRTYVYSGFGVIYGVCMCIGAFGMIFAKVKFTGGLLTLAWYFALCGLAILAGVVALLLERFLSVQAFNAMTIDEQIALCEKQSKYYPKRKRKRQIRRLKGNARHKDMDRSQNEQQSQPEQQPTPEQVEIVVTQPTEPIVTISQDEPQQVEAPDTQTTQQAPTEISSEVVLPSEQPMENPTDADDDSTATQTPPTEE